MDTYLIKYMDKDYNECGFGEVLISNLSSIRVIKTLKAAAMSDERHNSMRGEECLDIKKSQLINGQ